MSTWHWVHSHTCVSVCRHDSSQCAPTMFPAVCSARCSVSCRWHRQLVLRWRRLLRCSTVGAVKCAVPCALQMTSAAAAAATTISCSLPCTAGYWAYGRTVSENILFSLDHPRGIIALAAMMVLLHVTGSYQVYSMPVSRQICTDTCRDVCFLEEMASCKHTLRKYETEYRTVLSCRFTVGVDADSPLTVVGIADCRLTGIPALLRAAATRLCLRNVVRP